jgi:hypothetical protein
MFYRDVYDRYFDDIQALGDAHNPVVAAHGHETEGDSFIEGFGGDFDGVLNTIHIFDGDAAGADRHNGMNLAYSLFLRHSKTYGYFVTFLPELSSLRDGFTHDEIGSAVGLYCCTPANT